MIKLLDFYADWCSPCKAMEPIFEEVKEEYKGKVEFKAIDVDQNNERAREYGVMSIPTYIIINDEKEVDRIIGARPKSEFTKWLDSHLG